MNIKEYLQLKNECQNICTSKYNKEIFKHERYITCKYYYINKYKNTRSSEVRNILKKTRYPNFSV